jgi:hypothetical protein
MHLCYLDEDKHGSDKPCFAARGAGASRVMIGVADRGRCAADAGTKSSMGTAAPAALPAPLPAGSSEGSA